MAQTIREHVADGVTTLYDVSFDLGYIRSEFVYVYSGAHDTYAAQLSYTWISSSQIEVTEAIGTKFYIRRVIPKNVLINDYEDDAILHEANLDTSFLQALMIAEETQDGFFDRALVTPIGSSPYTLPVPESGKVLAWNEAATDIINRTILSNDTVPNPDPTDPTKEVAFGTIAELKVDDSLKVGDIVLALLSNDEKGKNDRQQYRVMDLSSPATNGPLADDIQIIALNNGFYAVAVQSMGDSNIPFSVNRLNMHFGVMKGIPWNALEAGGSVTYTASTTANPGDMSLSLTNVTGLVADQLICYRATNGQYYTTVTESIAGNVLTLRAPIESVVTPADSIHNFYVNSSHANPFGFYAITDYALRELTHSYRKVAEVAHDEWGALLGAETLALTSTENIYAPGSSSNEYLHVTTTAVADQGVVSDGNFELPEGLYKIRGYINPGSVNAGADFNTVQLAVSQTITSTAVTQVVAQTQWDGQDASRSFELLYYAANDSTQRLIIRSRLAPAGEFEIGKIEIMRVEDTLTNMDTSKHVMLGDSWYAFGDIQDRITDRLPNAVIFQEGVGGNQASQLVARFDADCAVHKPDYVWIMCGTNDYFGNVSLDTFEFNMNILKEKIAALGATAIFFDPSVGEIDNGSYLHNFNVSRTYALRGSYTPATVRQSANKGLDRVQFFINQVIPLSATVLIGMPPGTTIRSYNIIRSFFNSASFNVQAGYRSAIGVPNENVVTYAANTLIQPASPQLVATPAGGRFLAIAIENTTGGALTCNGYIEVEYTPVV